MYQALYRKYRPRTFDEVVGQNGVTQTLKMQLLSGRLSHAYLFTGSRGTGKTSCAKILAKAVNCEHPEDGNPCNRCAACRAIDDGSCMDVLEIDAASNNGVDNVRSLRDDAVFPPAEVKMRVYIIDEVHMLSMSAFNALLKTIEEPPAHLLFILATTELHKVPATILSRCQRFSFRRLMPEDVASRINECAWHEGIEIDQQAIELISRLADGSMRDGMSLLDQCASSTEGAVSVDSIYRCLGLASSYVMADMLHYVAQKDTAKLLNLFAEQYSAGKDLGAMIDELTLLCRDLLILKTAANSTNLIAGVCSKAELDSLLSQFTSAQLLRMTELLQKTASGFNRTANRRIDVELCLMQMCDESLNMDNKSIMARVSRLEAQLSSGIHIAPIEQTYLENNNTEFESEPPSSQTSPQIQTNDEFWSKLCSCIIPQIGREAWLFQPERANHLRGLLQGDILRVYAEDAFTRGRVEKQKELIEKVGSQLLGKPLHVVFGILGEQQDMNLFDSIIQYGQQHPDIIHIQK